MKKFGFHSNNKTDKHDVFEYDLKAYDIGLLKIHRVVASLESWHEAMVCCKALNVDWENGRKD
jgi:hypothetical protein